MRSRVTAVSVAAGGGDGAHVETVEAANGVDYDKAVASGRNESAGGGTVQKNGILQTIERRRGRRRGRRNGFCSSSFSGTPFLPLASVLLVLAVVGFFCCTTTTSGPGRQTSWSLWRHGASLSSVATADLSDAHAGSLSVVEPGILHHYSARHSFYGPVETIRCLESNLLLRNTLEEPGRGRVLVVDGGGSRRVSLMGENLSKLAQRSGWAGVVVNGCIRDSVGIASVSQLGVLARGTHPRRALKNSQCERGVSVTLGGVEFQPNHWIYADEDGVLVSETPLHEEPPPQSSES